MTFFCSLYCFFFFFFFPQQFCFSSDSKSFTPTVIGMKFDASEYEKKRQAARAAYLQQKTAQRQAVAQAVVNQKMEEIEQGLVPSSVAEADLLLQRSREVQAAKGLVAAVQSGANTENDAPMVEPYLEDLHKMVSSDSSDLPGAVQKMGESKSDKTSEFIEMTAEEIKKRVESTDFGKEILKESAEDQVVTSLQQQHEKIQAQRKSLPIYRARQELIDAVKKNPVLVVVGETGSGKTTQLLQYLYEEGVHCRTHSAAASDTGEADKVAQTEELRLVCTQPRRIAAMSVAKRVAQEMGCRCGGLVGYKVRFDEKCSAVTKIFYVTDGIMLKEFTNDPSLEQTAVIMVDEAHERSLNSDILLGLLRDVVRQNTSVRVIIASASINAEQFSQFFGGAPIFTVTGRTYPVEMFYTEQSVGDYVTEAAETAMGIHLTKPLPGDILIFLPGQESIETCIEVLSQFAQSEGAQVRPLLLLPIYSSLPPDEQVRIYQSTPPGVRKVVVATNIAETSITIDGVVYVIDCGLCKQNYYNPHAMTEELRVVPISQASALQRAGRAGRTQPGECYRLYTPYTFHNELPPDTIPEVRRCSMSTVVLQLKVLGIDNLLQFDFLDPPSTASLEIALDQLFLLGAMTAEGVLTVTGRRMGEFPLEPSWSKALIRSSKLGCARHMAMAASILTLESVFLNTSDKRCKQNIESAKDVFFSNGNGDVTGFVNLMEGWLRSSSVAGLGPAEFCRVYGVQRGAMQKARDVLDQILATMDRVGLTIGPEAIEAKQVEDDYFTGGPSSFVPHASVVQVEPLTKALLSGFFYNVARLDYDQRRYTIVRPMESSDLSPYADPDEGAEANGLVEIHPASYLFGSGVQKGDRNLDSQNQHGPAPLTGGVGAQKAIPPVLKERPGLVVFTSLRHTSKRFMVHVTAIYSPDWVLECAPKNYFQRGMLEDGRRKRTRE